MNEKTHFDFIAYDVNNLLIECIGRENASRVSNAVLPEIKRTLRKRYTLDELKTLLGKVLINLMKGEKL